MTWITALAAVYDKNEELAGIKRENEYEPLIPLYHGSKKADLEILLTETGALCEIYAADGESTVIPVTEDSVCRTCDILPHALADSLQYLAPCLKEIEKGKIKEYREHHEAYLEALENWCRETPHPKALAVLNYIKNGTILFDLVNKGMLCENGDGTYSKAKIKSTNGVRSLFVRFSVVTSDDDDLESECHRDRSLFQNWQSYCRSKKQNVGLCYATGEQCALSEKHRKFIRHPGDGTKLISANDTTNFTFRGIFETAGQARGVGGEVSQKAHLALKWLISKKSFRCDDELVFVCWPNYDPDLATSLNDDIVNSFTQSDSDCDTEEEYAKVLLDAIAGFKAKAEPEGTKQSKMFVMGVNSVNDKGRMAVIYFKELAMDDFWNRIRDWYQTCCWTLDYFKNSEKDAEKKLVYTRIGTPTPFDIFRAAYGIVKDESAKKLRRAIVEKLVYCIVDGKNIPYEIVASAVRRTTNRSLFEKESEWMRSMAYTAAIYRKYYSKENYTMALDESRKSRDYLFGRLLAAADYIESLALFKLNEKRQTAAQRFFARFATFPMSTWKDIEIALRPYLEKLDNTRFFTSKLDEIASLIDAADFNDKPLSGEFLLGYHNQRLAFYNKNKKEENKTEETE